ncbi:hypothetical protein C2E23DRAFT_841444 [Lenzites betulinus]|nr:hypothetical protein C2E23DRAFT_841444 [Lenzites betulinus]
MSGYSEKQHFAPEPSPRHEEAPPSYDKDLMHQWSSDAGYRSGPSYPSYAPPPGPPPTFNSYNPYAPSPNAAPSYNPYATGSYGPIPGGMSPAHPPNTHAPLYPQDSGYRPSLPGQRFPELLNPPPPSFQRAPSRSMPYGPFAPLEVAARGHGRDLALGFDIAPPPSATQPHPFGTHDVKESDWLRFLEDVRRAGALAARDRPEAAASSMSRAGRSGGLLSGLVSQGIQSMQGSRTGTSPQDLAPLIELLQHWNQYFFNQRAMEVDVTGPVDDTQAFDDAASQSSTDSDRSRRSRRRSRCKKRSGGGPISSALRELKTDLMDRAAAGGSSGSSQRWYIVIRYKPVGGW